jgi:hypothetical protein
MKLRSHWPALLADCQAICGVQELVQMCVHCRSRQPLRFG